MKEKIKAFINELKKVNLNIENDKAYHKNMFGIHSIVGSCKNGHLILNEKFRNKYLKKETVVNIKYTIENRI